uniref:VWFA domain-containing protein n=1 Tax=Odontella aurita TaxID=265563 RepID=A0A7S4KB44_9STRA
MEATHKKVPSKGSSSANSGSAITPAPNNTYYQKESAWMGRLAERNSEVSFDAGFGSTAAGQVQKHAQDTRHTPCLVNTSNDVGAGIYGTGAVYGSAYGAQTEPNCLYYDADRLMMSPQQQKQGRRHNPSGRRSPSRRHSPSHTPSRAAVTSIYGSETGDITTPYSSGEHYDINSRYAHGGMTPEQYDAYKKAQERTLQQRGTVANPHLVAAAGDTAAEEAIHFGSGNAAAAAAADSILDPAGGPPPSRGGNRHRHRGRAIDNAADRSSVASSVPSGVAHGGMTPEQLDAYRKAQEKAAASGTAVGFVVGTGGGGGGTGQLANPRLAALSMQEQEIEDKSRLKEDNPIRQGRVVPVWESRRDGLATADVEPAPAGAPGGALDPQAAGTGARGGAGVAQEQIDAYEKARAQAGRSGGGAAIAQEQVDAYEKARARGQVGAAQVANPRLAAASAAGGGGVALEQVEAYAKAQARAQVGASQVANPRLAAASGAGGPVAQEQVDAYAKAQAREGVQRDLVAQEQVDAYAKAQAKGVDVPATPRSHPLERTQQQQQQQQAPGRHHQPDIRLDVTGGAHPSRSADQSPYARRADEDAVPRHREGINEELMSRHLITNGFTTGLASALVSRCASCPLRVWLVDNSGSMLGTDGHRVVQDARTQGRVNAVDCTRWEEVSSAVTWHAQMCAVLKAPVVFRMLNDPGRPFPQQMSVAERSAAQLREQAASSNRDDAAEQQLLAGGGHLVRETFRRTRPTGGSNLSRHLRAIYDSVSGMADNLRQDKQRVAVVVVTDGFPTDDFGTESDDNSDEFVDILRKFAGLPVWIVIRLSTDERRVIEYYNGIDSYFSELGPDLSVDVLDDFVGEAGEVRRANPWLNYALPLHLCRESGMRFEAFDALDERLLRPSEVRDVCNILFGRGPAAGPMTGSAMLLPFPDPDDDWPAFSQDLRRAVESEREQWDPVKEKVAPWIDFRELERIYSGGVVSVKGVGGAGAGAILGSAGGMEPEGKKQGCACVIQ